MKIELKKFGTILVSRELGREAYAALQSRLKELKPADRIRVDFNGVDVLSPSWADEFLTPLHKHFGDRFSLGRSDNRSIRATLAMLEKVNRIKFNTGVAASRSI